MSSGYFKNGDLVTFGRRNYGILRQIGSGSFGQIYLISDVETRKQFAVKVEAASRKQYSLLKHECEVMSLLKGHRGFSTVSWFGRCEPYNILIMDHLGPSLEQLFEYCSHQFSLQTVLMLAYQMITLLESLHDKNVVHRDIKPSNFVLGIGTEANVVMYLIDFGISRAFHHTGKHILYREDRALSGTARYVSLNGHFGIEQSRRDDLEALGHMLIEFLKGKLPWENIIAESSSEKDVQMRSIKLSMSLGTLTDGCPVEFLQYMTYCRGLQFEETPDYEYLQRIFSCLLEKVAVKTDTELIFDWIKKPQNPHKHKLSQHVVV